jgi:hypothetical protein
MSSFGIFTGIMHLMTEAYTTLQEGFPVHSQIQAEAEVALAVTLGEAALEAVELAVDGNKKAKYLSDITFLTKNVMTQLKSLKLPKFSPNSDRCIPLDWFFSLYGAHASE